MRKKVIFATLAATLLIGLIFINFNVPEKKVEREIPHLSAVDDPQFMRSMGLLLGPAILEGNKASELINGDRIFPSMLETIRGAKKTILFETYIYWSGDIGNEFADALSERARAGVKVHVLMDWVGSGKADEAMVEKMKSAGVEVEKFHPLRWYNLGRMNNRTHRKLLIVDGAIGFTGGVGIAQIWTGNAQDPNHWRDSHFRVEGPVVAQMQSVMLDNWVKTTGKVLVSAVRRGVKVRIITPGENMDAETVRRASRGLWGELLEAGVELHEYQPTMYHVKAMIVDGLMTSVGSTNFDVRSFRLNDEANLNVYDAGFARRQTEVFEADLKQSRRITFEAWRTRPLSGKLREHALALIGPLL